MKCLDNIPDFILYIRKEVLLTFKLSYKKSKMFLDKYDKSLLTDDDIEYELSQFISVKNNMYYIDNEHVEILLKIVYQQLVYKIINILVDDGILQMCWDSDKMDFVWSLNVKKIHIVTSYK